MHKRPLSLEALIGFASVIAIGIFLGLGAVMGTAPAEKEVAEDASETVERNEATTVSEKTTAPIEASPAVEPTETPNPHPSADEPTPTEPTEGVPEIQPLIKVSIQVTSPAESSTYHVAVPQESTVEEAMSAAKEEGLRYTSKNYVGIGSYVSAINGLSEDRAAEMYWVYYINGTSATAGISTLKLNAKDAIRWNYEKSF